MARREFARIGTDMPDEPSVRALTHDEQWLYDHALYLRAEMSRCGVVPYRPAVWAELSTTTTESKCRRWLKGLQKHRMVVVDEKYSEVLLRTYVRHDGLLGQPNVVANMVADFTLIHSPLIRAAFLTEMRRIWDLPDLSAGARGGWQLAMGHYPQPATERGHAWPTHIAAGALDRLRKSIGTGLAEALTEHITEGFAPGFTEPIPEPFTQPPYAGARAAAIAVNSVPGPDSGSERRSRAPGAVAVTTPPDQPRDDDNTVHKLLDEHTTAISRPLPTATIDALRTAIHQALTDTNGDVDLVTAALARLRQRGGKPGLLTHLIGDLQTERAAGTDDALNDPEVRAWLEQQEAAR